MALYQQVKDHVMRKIADGSLSAGERVPSEQELVQEFGVARMTANRALRELQAAETLRAAAALRLFPAAAGVRLLERKFGGAVTLVDTFGASDPAAHALEEATARAAFTGAVARAHALAAAVDARVLWRRLLLSRLGFA